MVKYSGKDFLIEKEVDATPGTFSVIGGLQSTGMTLNNEQVDVTTKGDMPWRELQPFGVRSMSLSGGGVFEDDTALAEVLAAANSGALKNYKLTSGYGDEFEGSFLITSFERGGEHNAEETFSITLESAGVVAYTAPT